MSKEYSAILMKIQRPSIDKEHMKNLKAELKVTSLKHEKLKKESEKRSKKLIKSNFEKTALSDQIKSLKRDNDRTEGERVSAKIKVVMS
jgi:hypothetical protein